MRRGSVTNRQTNRQTGMGGMEMDVKCKCKCKWCHSQYGMQYAVCVSQSLVPASTSIGYSGLKSGRKIPRYTYRTLFRGRTR